MPGYGRNSKPTNRQPPAVGRTQPAQPAKKTPRDGPVSHCRNWKEKNMGHRLTTTDINKMQEEITHRKTEVRTELLEKLKTARAQGDLSENFEYHAAKREKAKNDSRIRFLERMIRNAEIIEDHVPEDRAGIGKTVTFLVEEDQEEEQCSIVSTMLSNSLENRVSIESPVGKALSGHGVGDRVYIKVNDHYGYYVVIKKIEKFNDEDVPINAY